MPLPERYAREVPDIESIWATDGCFKSQIKVWTAQCKARNELYGRPTKDELIQIQQAFVLAPEDIIYLEQATGHETNRLLRLIQSRLPPEIGNYIHNGNTSSDILDTSLALRSIASLDILSKDCQELEEALLSLALQHKATIQIGRTHGQHAIPQTFGRHALTWYTRVGRDLDRIARARKVIAVGKCSGEIGTNVFISPELEEKTLARLKLAVDPAPTQIISRDRHAEVISLLAVNSTTLDQIATDIRLLSLTEIGEIREPFDGSSQQGSSAMPHKRNSELTERVCGISGRLLGASLEQQRAATLWLQRDISHSSAERFTFPDSFGCMVYGTRLLTEVIRGLVVYTDKMAANLDLALGCIYSPRLLNSLLAIGKLSRTQTYDLVKSLAHQALDQKIPLLQLIKNDNQITPLLTTSELEQIFSPRGYLQNINIAYSRLDLNFPSLVEA